MESGRSPRLQRQVIVLASGTLWYFESPAWTLQRMKGAAQSHDADALNVYIDYPALRDSLKAQLTARMMAEAPRTSPVLARSEWLSAQQ